jgi:Rrf2 family iron-sulfur cluster assembly transcriptional regulator
MLRKRSIHALKALLELSASQQDWRSTPDLARCQDLPEPLLEQILLQLRRAGLLEARRGRLGGFRLQRPPSRIQVAEVVALMEPMAVPDSQGAQQASSRVTSALERRLHLAVLQTLEALTLEDLLYDLLSAEAEADTERGLLLG